MYAQSVVYFGEKNKILYNVMDVKTGFMHLQIKTVLT